MRSDISDGLWPQLRGDHHLSGVQQLPGNIIDPTVTWSYYLGGVLLHATVTDTEEGTVLLLLEGGCIVRRNCVDGSICWKSEPQGFDAIYHVGDPDDDGILEVIAGNSKSIFTLRLDDGQILWQEYLGPPFATGINLGSVLVHRFPNASSAALVCVALLSAREVIVYDFATGSASPTRRHILWMDDFYHPSLLAADIDNDGEDELIVTKLSAVYAFDIANGILKHECIWESGGTRKRNYGLFQVVDLNRDGRLDIVILAHLVSRHLAVVENGGAGALSNRWDRFIEHIYPSDEKELRYTFHSCCDIDGDGRYELIVSIFNEANDGRWKLHVLDAWTGEEKCTLEDRYLYGVNDGYVFVGEVHDRFPPTCVTISALRWEDTGFVEVWAKQQAGFYGRFVTHDAQRTTLRADLVLRDEIWCEILNGSRVVLIRDQDGTLNLLSTTDWSLTPVPNSNDAVVILAVADLDGDGSSEILYSSADGRIQAVRVDGSKLFAVHTGMRIRYGTGLYYAPRPMAVPIVFKGEDSQRYCAVPDAADNIHLIKTSDVDSSINIVWIQKGRGRIGQEEMHHSVLAERIDNVPCVLFSEIGEGDAAIVAMDIHGTVRKRWCTPLLPASPFPPRNRTGIQDYVLLHNNAAQQLIISGYRSPSMNSERMCGVSSETGEEMWSGTIIGQGEEGRGFGPWNAMSVHNNNDQTELCFLAKDIFCRINAYNGQFITEPWYLRSSNTTDLIDRGITTDDFAAYGSLSLCDVDNDGNMEWVTMMNYGGTGVINQDGSVRWWLSGGLSLFASAFGCVADLDIDGVKELAVATVNGDLLCLNASTGKEHWRLHIGQTISDIVACDIDGDGNLEWIASTQQGDLLCIAEWRNGCGYIKWRKSFGYSLGPPIIADVDGDGGSEILVVCGDGNLYCVK